MYKYKYKHQVSGVECQVSNSKYTISAIKVLVPFLKVPALCPKPHTSPQWESTLTWPWAISLHRCVANASEGPKTMESLSAERPMAPKHRKTKTKIAHGLLCPSRDPPKVIPWLPGLPQGPPDAIPEPSRALPEPSQGSPGALCK